MSEEGDNTEGDGVDNSQAVADAIERPEHVPEKFWNDETKTTNHDDVLKSYNELSGKFGSFTGAPEAYEFKLNDDLTERGLNLDMDNPLISTFQEKALAAGMNQDMANEMVNMFVENQLADSILAQESETARVADEMGKLGDNAQQRVSNIENWAQANLNEEERDGLIEMATTAGAVKAIEGLIAKSRNAPMQNTDMSGAGQVDMAELQKLQFAKDDHGNRKMATDPAYAKMVRAKMAQAFPGENIITVG